MAFAVPVIVYGSHITSNTLSTMLVVNGGCGIGVGILLSMESVLLRAQRNVFLGCASVVATLCGMLGCLLFGPMGLAGMAAGVLLSTTSFVIYRNAAV